MLLMCCDIGLTFLKKQGKVVGVQPYLVLFLFLEIYLIFEDGFVSISSWRVVKGGMVFFLNEMQLKNSCKNIVISIY